MEKACPLKVQGSRFTVQSSKFKVQSLGWPKTGSAGASPYRQNYTGFCVSGGAGGGVRGRLFLARLPETFQHAGQ
jgi:hypothetical protein